MDTEAEGGLSLVRSRIMRAVPRRDTGPEMKVRSALHALGYRYHVHARNLPGTPDIVFTKRRLAVFVHGCFWHRHGCRLSTMPKSRVEFWSEKFRRNQERDRAVARRLHEMGWRVVEVWECEVRTGAYMQRLRAELGPPSFDAGKLPGTRASITAPPPHPSREI